MPDVEIQEIQAEIENQRDRIEADAPNEPDTAEVTRLVRELNARDKWRAARLSAG